MASNNKLRVGILGTGAIAHKHIQAYRNIGFPVTACWNRTPATAGKFAEQYGIRTVGSWEELCADPEVDLVDVCSFPDFRLDPVRAAAKAGKHIQVQKPIATNLETAQAMIDTAQQAGVLLGVVSQHRFDDSTQFLKRALEAGRLGKLLQADAYVKWHRSKEYYSRAIKGSWEVEGGGALINQGIHQVDILLWLMGGVSHVSASWLLGSVHNIESEDVVDALWRYDSGALGVMQAATAFWPGYPERIEIHGSTGTAVISGDRLTTWDVRDDKGEPAPVSQNAASGASDPMAIGLTSFERQFQDFADAAAQGRKPLSSGEDGYRALQLVLAVYRSCREEQRVMVHG